MLWTIYRLPPPLSLSRSFYLTPSPYEIQSLTVRENNQTHQRLPWQLVLITSLSSRLSSLTRNMEKFNLPRRQFSLALMRSTYVHFDYGTSHGIQIY